MRRLILPHILVPLLVLACGEEPTLTAPDGVAPPVALSVIAGDVTLSSQAEVDAFLATEVTGVLTITGADISNLDGLSSLTSIGAGLSISSNPVLTNVGGLSSLTSISLFGLSIRDNPLLANLDALSSLTFLNSLAIGDNLALTNLDGLSSLTSVHNGVNIFRNPSLTNLTGLSSMSTSTSTDLNIRSNGMLTDLVLPSVTSLNTLFVLSNDGLTSLDGLSSLTLVRGELFIAGNPVLTNVDGLSGLMTSTDDGLVVDGNGGLADCSGLVPLLKVQHFEESNIMILNNAPGCNSLTEVLNHTATGFDTEVVPFDETTGEPGPITMTFDNVTASGETTITSSEPGEPPLPSEFRFGEPATSYSIETTATFLGSVEICLDYSGVTYADETLLKLLHYDEATSTWEDVTILPIDTVNDIVCGSVTSFSPFVLAESLVLESLQQLIDELAALDGNVTAAMIGRLENVIASIERGNEGPALNQLEAIINQLEGLIGAGRLDPVVGEFLIGFAQGVIDQLLGA